MQRCFRRLSAVVVVALLASCTLNQPPAPGVMNATPVPNSANPSDASVSSTEPTVITFGAFALDQRIFEPLIDEFNNANPDVSVQFVPVDEIYRQSPPSDDPDRFLRAYVSAVDTATSPGVTNFALNHGYVYDLQPLIDADASFDPHDFYPGTLDEGRRNGKTFRIPRTLRVPLLAYNKELWDTYVGEPPQPDWTIEDLVDAAAQLAVKRDKAVERFGMVGWSPSEDILLHAVAKNGVNLLTTSREDLNLNQPAVADGLAQLAELVRTGAVYLPAYNDNTSLEMDALIRSGKAGIYEPEMFMRGAGEALPHTAGYLHTMVPPGAALGDTEGYIVSGGTRHLEAAWRWLSFLSRQDVRLPGDPGLAVGGVLPARKSVAERVGYWEQLEPEVKVAVEAALRLRSTPVSSVDYYDSNGSYFWQPLRQALNTVVRGEQSAEEALHDAQAALEQAIAAERSRPRTEADTQPIIVSAPSPNGTVTNGTQIRFGATRSSVSRARLFANQFNQQQPDVQVTVKEVPPSNGTLTLTTVAEGNDCFAFPAPPTPDERAGLLDLQPLLDADATFSRDEYPTALLAPFQNGTQLYGLPDLVTVSTLGYNHTLFTDAGSSPPTATWTTDDLLNAAQQLTRGTGDDQHYGYASLGNMPRELGFFLARAGASPLAIEGGTVRATLTDPNAVQVVTDYLALLREFSPHTRFLGYTSEQLANDALALIADGKVAMWLNLENTGGEFPTAAATAPIPIGTGTLTADDVQTTGLYISAATQQAEACWTWLKALSGSTTGISTAGQGPARLPARSSIATSAGFTRQAPHGTAEMYSAYQAALQRSGKTVKPGALDVLNGYWFFRAVDRALQGKNLQRELEDAQLVTEQYLTCVQSDETPGVCARQVDPEYQGVAEP